MFLPEGKNNGPHPAILVGGMLAMLLIATAGFFAAFVFAYEQFAPNPAPIAIRPEDKPYAPPPVAATSVRPAVPKPTAPSVTPGLPIFEDANRPIPERLSLDIPFTVQAPSGKWVQPFEDACEEASVIMVRAYLNGDRNARIPVAEAEQLILDIAEFEDENYGVHLSTSLAETKRFLEAFFPDLEAEILPVTSATSIKQLIAAGHPVILPFDGRIVGNPNFQNGGPPYHMAVVRGYTATHFITNEPGTRLGENYRYPINVLMNAIHDWNGGDVRNGAKVMMILRKKK